MPNWNSNKLVVKGEGKAVLDFIKENYLEEKVQGKVEECDYVLDFEKFLPTPLKDDGSIIDDWYDWRLENWGCKWSPLPEQQNSLTIEYKDGKQEYYNSRSIGVADGFELDEKNIDKLLDKSEDIKEVELESYFETPWCPPYSIVSKWNEKYKNIELKCKYYEPGCCFAGIIGFNKGDKWYDIYHEGWVDEDYTTFLLEEGWEETDWYEELIRDLLDEMYPEDKEFVDKLYVKILEQLESTDDNREKAKLITDIQNKYYEHQMEEDKKETKSE